MGDILHRVLPYQPFTRWLGELRDGAVLRADVLAGITVAMVVIPQSMANARLADLPPVYGLYAACLPPVVAALFGSSRQLSTGPVALASLISVATVQTVASPGSPDFIAYSILLALMVGVIRLSLGVFRLGMLVNLLSSPVTIGFTNAAALIIAGSQLHHIFGVKIDRGDHFHETVRRTVDSIQAGIRWDTFGMSLLALAILIGFRRFGRRRLPHVLIAAGVTIFASWVTGYGGAIVGAIPKGLPSFGVPSIDQQVVPYLAVGAVVITVVGFMEAMAIAKTIATKTKQQIDINQELIGQGLANVAGSFFGSYVVSGSFARSQVNFSSGARTGFASVVASLAVVVSLFWLTPLLYYLPQATLAAIIITAVANLVKVKPVIRAWRVQPQDGVIAVITFVSTLALAPALHYGIFIGVALSLVTDLYRTMRPRITCLARLPDGSLRDAEVDDLRRDDRIAAIRFDGRLYFEACGYFEDKVLEIVRKLSDLRYLIIDAGGINRIDATGELTLRDLVGRLRDTNVDVYFTNVKKQCRDIFERTGFVDLVGEEHFLNWNQQAWDHLAAKAETGG